MVVDFLPGQSCGLIGKTINLFLVRRWVDGWEGVWRCGDLEEEEMHFVCTATGVLCFVF